MNDEIPLMLEREAGAPEYVSAIAVGFGLMPLESKRKSAEAGHPVFEDRLFFKGVIPGDKNQISIRIANQKDFDRFPRAYAAFKQRETTPIQGMPIEEWPQIARSQALTFKAMHIFTVESLAEVHDGHIDKLGQNARELRTKAKAFLAQAKDSAAAQKIAAENDALKMQLADMQRQINDLGGRVGHENISVKGGTAGGSGGRMGRPPGSKNKPKEAA